MRTLPRLAVALLLSIVAASPLYAETSSWVQEIPQTENPKDLSR